MRTAEKLNLRVTALRGYCNELESDTTGHEWLMCVSGIWIVTC
jgi:hypothetical protein